MSVVERTASCLCGKVTLKLTGEPMLKNVCYCGNCAKLSGATSPGFLAFPSSAVEISDPQAVIKVFKDEKCDSGSVLLRSFCGECGARIKNQQSQNLDVSVIPVGLVDGDTKGLEPSYEFYAKRKPDWFPGFPSAESFPECPDWLVAKK